MATNAAIWRATTSEGASEASAATANIIEFNETPITSTGKYFMSTNIDWRVSVPENERVAGDINNVQDMGADGLDYEITGKIKDSSSTSSTHAIAILRDWQREAKKINPDYKKGRFGIRLDDMPQFNITPTSTYGLILANIRLIREPDTSFIGSFVLNLRFSGDFDGVGA